jgi:hippurate hydrolase
LCDFDGTVYFIFQPAEEHEGGGRVMVEEGLFQRFPMDMVFGLHNWPGLPAGSFGVTEGPVMAGTDRFEIGITGHGGHAAMPHQATDVVVAGSSLVHALQTLVSRVRDPLDPAVISVTRFHAGSSDNVLPETAVLGGIFEEISRNDVEKVPFLGDLPFLGYLFKVSGKAEEKIELLIFLTPRIIDERISLR